MSEPSPILTAHPPVNIYFPPLFFLSRSEIIPPMIDMLPVEPPLLQSPMSLMTPHVKAYFVVVSIYLNIKIMICHVPFELNHI